MGCRWTILIATLGRRRNRFLTLLDTLLPQVEPYHGDVQVLTYWNNFERPLADIRQTLVEHATGQYVNFIDDDDEIPPYYCAQVHPLLDGRVDYIGWRMQAILDGRRAKPTFHSIGFHRWFEDDDGYYRHASHLNPVRRDLALKVDFRLCTDAEDVSWADQIAPLLHTERYISREMYRYHFSTADSSWRLAGHSTPDSHHVRPAIDHPYFAYHPDCPRST